MAQEGGRMMLQGNCVSVLGRREEKGKKNLKKTQTEENSTVLPRNRAARDGTAGSAR